MKAYVGLLCLFSAERIYAGLHYRAPDAIWRRKQDSRLLFAKKEVYVCVYLCNYVNG